MNILLRTDSSSNIGTGHIMRDLVLAQHYAKKGNNIIFATQELKDNISHKIQEANYQLKILKDESVSELNILIQEFKIDMIVIDHYSIDHKFEKKLKLKNPYLKILSFDDTYEKHHCDILLNHNISGDKKKYEGLVPEYCELRCGKKYTLLRDEFYKEKNKTYKKTNKFIIFIAMGGADHSNINIDILKIIKKIKNFNNTKINIVTTTANKNIKELEKYCKNKQWIKLHINSSKIAKIMAKSDLALVTPSVTVNEVYFMKIPFIAIKTADNQMDMYKYLKKKKYLVLKKFDKTKLKKDINKMIKRLL